MVKSGKVTPVYFVGEDTNNVDIRLNVNTQHFDLTFWSNIGQFDLSESLTVILIRLYWILSLQNHYYLLKIVKTNKQRYWWPVLYYNSSRFSLWIFLVKTNEAPWMVLFMRRRCDSKRIYTKWGPSNKYQIIKSNKLFIVCSAIRI